MAEFVLGRKQRVHVGTNTACLATRPTSRPKIRNPATCRSEDMADVVIRVTDHGVDISLILTQHRNVIVVGVRMKAK